MASKLTCEMCDKTFSQTCALRRHYRNIHHKTFQPSTSLKCGICNSTFSKLSDYNNHVINQHEIVLDTINIKFKNVSEFESWKKSVEEEQQSFFIKKRGNKRPMNDSITLIAHYQCNRSGNFKGKSSSPTQRKRHIKIQGSSKINAYCPARIKANFNTDGSINVSFCKTHVGHSAQLAHIPLPKGERKQIASKIAQKVPFEAILDDVQGSVSGEIKRKHILTKQDLRNITKAYCLESKCVRRSDDALSFEAWVDQVCASDNNCILLYKPNGVECLDYPDLKSEDFMFGIMTDAQAEMLKKYGHDCICIDSTHGTNAYEFEMTTLLVLDEMRQGFPCAFYFSNRNDQIDITIFLASIRDRVGIVNTNVLMTDMAGVFYDSWKCVMGDVERRLFCTWHVQCDWQKNINKIKNNIKRMETCKKIFTLHFLVDENAFEIILPLIVSELCGDSDTAEFGKYFKDNYVENPKSWAHCYRKDDCINTNMHLERLHGIFQHFYLRGKMVKRLNSTVHGLMRSIIRKLFDRLIVFHKGKLSSNARKLRERHKRSLSLNIDNVLQLANNTWAVFCISSVKLDVFTVTLNDTSCNCSLICEHCKACTHKLSCTCTDSCVQWNMCKHIHLVCRALINDNAIETKTEDNGDSENGLDTTKQVLTEDENSYEKRVTLSAVSSHAKKCHDSNLDSLKQEVSDSFSVIMSKIQSSEQLEIMRNALISVEAQINEIADEASSSSSFEPFHTKSNQSFKPDFFYTG